MEKEGNWVSIDCPHCGKINTYVTQGQDVKFDKIFYFQKTCHHCQKTVYYKAVYEIKIIAYDQNPLDSSRIVR